MGNQTEEANKESVSSSASCAEADSDKPTPEFDPGDLVDAFGYYEVVESRHWSEMWETWMYCFEHEEGRTPESEVSEPDRETTRYSF